MGRERRGKKGGRVREITKGGRDDERNRERGVVCVEISEHKESLANYKMVLRSVIAFVALVSPTHSLSWSNPLIPSDAPDVSVHNPPPSGADNQTNPPKPSPPLTHSSHKQPGCMYDPLSSLYHCVHTCNGAGAKCTNPQGNFPIYTSPTLSNFTYAGVAMPSEGNKGWGEDRFWAPEIHLTSPGSYRLVYTAGNKDGDLCIGLAASESPLGPYADVSDSPLLCNSDADEVVKGVGLIDGHVVVSDTGACTLFYKVDGNADGTGGTKDVIRKVNLDEDCVSVVEEDVGKHEFVLRNELEWEGSCVEAPWYVQRDGYEYVFYSSSMYNTVNYNVGVARRQVGEGDGEWEKVRLRQAALTNVI